MYIKANALMPIVKAIFSSSFWFTVINPKPLSPRSYIFLLFMYIFPGLPLEFFAGKLTNGFWSRI